MLVIYQLYINFATLKEAHNVEIADLKEAHAIGMSTLNESLCAQSIQHKKEINIVMEAHASQKQIFSVFSQQLISALQSFPQ